MTSFESFTLLAGVASSAIGFWLAIFSANKWFRLLGIYMTILGVAVLHGLVQRSGGAASNPSSSSASVCPRTSPPAASSASASGNP